jgi:hypothetical protein
MAIAEHGPLLRRAPSRPPHPMRPLERAAPLRHGAGNLQARHDFGHSRDSRPDRLIVSARLPHFMPAVMGVLPSPATDFLSKPTIADPPWDQVCRCMRFLLTGRSIADLSTNPGHALMLASKRSGGGQPRLQHRPGLSHFPLSPTGRHRRSSSAFETTLTEDNAIAAPAIIGLNSPAAASGIPTTL